LSGESEDIIICYVECKGGNVIKLFGEKIISGTKKGFLHR